MKTPTRWLVVLAIVFCSAGVLRAESNPFIIPKWKMDWYNAYMLYNSGVNEIATDPGGAVKTLQDAEKMIQLSMSEGGDYRLIQLSQLIGRALIIAESQAKSSPPKLVKKLVRPNLAIRPAPQIHAPLHPKIN